MGKTGMTRTTSTTAELDWDHAVQDIPDFGSKSGPKTGLSVEREAAPDELERLARALDLVACRSLRAEYAIAPTVGGYYRLSGRLRAEVSQVCVVTLEPVDSTIEEDFEAVFWPQEDMPAPESGELAIDDEPEREPIVAGQIAVGRVVFESLAAVLDPFPRKPGAVLDWQSSASAEAAGSKPASPFAVLANLKTKD
jgi:uncharacterized metal-binding protein YceD (DUF177 family)